jgi:RNA polymerase sigma-70 factor (ECF subfamily)
MDCWNRRGQISNDNPVAYLHTAVKFRVFKFASKSDRLSFYEPFEAMGLTASAATDNLYYKELERLVDLWMETLPEKRREIFRLHYKENLSTQMIADKLAISRKTVQNQLGIVFSDLRNQMPDMILILLLVYLFYV